MHLRIPRKPLAMALLAALIPLGPTSAAEEDPPELLGRCNADQLDQEPYSEWFRSGYADYTPNPAALVELRRFDAAELEVAIFFGTWCGDSRREVPRMLKILDQMGLPAANRRLIAVDGAEKLHKRSPGGEEEGMEVYRVPTVVVSRGGREVSRIVEYPALSLERDLLSILRGDGYQPSYASYPVVRRWLEEGLLADDNVSARGLANEVRHQIASEGELHAAARVLFSRGDTAEGVRLFQVNCALFPKSSLCRARLADALIRSGDLEQARNAAARAMELNDDPEEVKELVALVRRTLE